MSLLRDPNSRRSGNGDGPPGEPTAVCNLQCVIAACLAVLAVACLAVAAGRRGPTVSAAPLPPLKVDKAAPRLEDGPASTAPAQPGKRRLVCYDCHVNFQEEPFAAKHAAKEVTCITCHGESRAHASDENNITPPDRMYPRAAIAPACAQCHQTHNAPAAAILQRWKERGLQQTDPKKAVCTDCHGAHRLRVRTTRWDKATGKLLPKAKPPAGKGKRKG